MKNKEEIPTVTILGHIVCYEEHEEADWVGVEEAIANGRRKGFLFRYRTAIDVGKWWINDKTEEDADNK